MKTSEITAIIKDCEKKYESKVEFDDYLIVRIDGHKFSKFTKQFNKPFDDLLSLVMEKTTKDLIKQFGGSVGYTQSDEITLIFPPIYKEEKNQITNNQIFGGRTQKLTSLIAAYTSIRFNYWLSTEFKETDNRTYNAMIQNKMGTAWFDARAFGVPTKEDVCSVVLWRYRDAIKNSKSMFAQAYCSHKSLLNKSGEEQISFCLTKTGHNWKLVEDRFKYGIFVKKEKYVKQLAPDDKYFPNGLVERTRLTSFCDSTFEFSEKCIGIVVEKFI